MKTLIKSFARSLILAQALLLLCSTLCIPVSLASNKSDLDYADLSKLAGLETVIYGSAHKNLPNEKRVDSLEKILFGKTHNGTLHSRIFVISNALTGTAGDSLAPPLAPGLDREEPLKGAAPPVAERAQQNDWQSDENDIQAPSEAKRTRINNSLQQATQLYSQGQTSQAEAMFKNVLSLDSTNTDANYNLGAIAESRSDWQSALHYYQAALRGNPTDEDTKNAIESMQAKIAAANRNPQKLTPSKNIKLSAKQVDLLKTKVDQAADDYSKGNYDAAISTLKEVVAQAPDQADVYFALGQAYKAKGQTRQATDAFNQAVRLAPDNKQYSDALAALNNNGGQSPDSLAKRGVDTFSSNNPNSYQKPHKSKSGQNSASDQNNNTSADAAGEITPFSDSGSNNNDNELGWQPAGVSNGSYANTYYSPGTGSAYMPGYTYSNSIPYSMTYRIERAAIGGLAGAAMGSMFSAPGYRSGGAFAGGMMGGMMGFMGGRGGRRW